MRKARKGRERQGIERERKVEKDGGEGDWRREFNMESHKRVKEKEMRDPFFLFTEKSISKRSTPHSARLTRKKKKRLSLSPNMDNFQSKLKETFTNKQTDTQTDTQMQ